jgi:hypothetical protein
MGVNRRVTPATIQGSKIDNEDEHENDWGESAGLRPSNTHTPIRPYADTVCPYPPRVRSMYA